MKRNLKKRQRIRNLNIKEFNKLFSADEMVDFEQVKNSKISLLIDLAKSELTKDVGRWILALLAVAGIVTIAAVAPNFFLLFKNSRKRYYRKIPRETYNNCMRNLKQKGFVDLEFMDNGLIKLMLTEKGEGKAKEIQFNNIKISKPEKWDKKWRLVIFDISEKHKSERDALRNKLRDLGFYKLQDSVFIYPYECFKEIDIICRIYNITSFVRYLVVDEFYYDQEAREYFDLNQ